MCFCYILACVEGKQLVEENGGEKGAVKGVKRRFADMVLCVVGFRIPCSARVDVGQLLSACEAAPPVTLSLCDVFATVASRGGVALHMSDTVRQRRAVSLVFFFFLTW